MTPGSSASTALPLITHTRTPATPVLLYIVALQSRTTQAPSLQLYPPAVTGTQEEESKTVVLNLVYNHIMSSSLSNFQNIVPLSPGFLFALSAKSMSFPFQSPFNSGHKSPAAMVASFGWFYDTTLMKPSLHPSSSEPMVL